MPLSLLACATFAPWETVLNGKASVPGLLSDATPLWLLTNRICCTKDSSMLAPVAVACGGAAPAALSACVELGDNMHDASRREPNAITVNDASFMITPPASLCVARTPWPRRFSTRSRVAATVRVGQLPRRVPRGETRLQRPSPDPSSGGKAAADPFPACSSDTSSTGPLHCPP